MAGFPARSVEMRPRPLFPVKYRTGGVIRGKSVRTVSTLVPSWAALDSIFPAIAGVCY